MNIIKLGLIFGGKGGAHTVSIKAAQDIYQNLPLLQSGAIYQVIPFYVKRNGQWLSPSDSEEILREPIENIDELAAKDQTWKIPLDIYNVDIFISTILCGLGAGDGSIQGFLEVIGIPFVGSSTLGAVIGGDKFTTKNIFAQGRLPQVKYHLIDYFQCQATHQKIEDICDNLEAQFPYPWFVKPSRLGSSIGISKVDNRSQFKSSLTFAAQYDHRILIEEGVVARELSCGVLENHQASTSVVGEKIYAGEFNDYESKYSLGSGKFVLPNDLSESTIKKIKSMAIEAFHLTGCRDAARVDFFLLEDQESVLINEINTVFGLGMKSFYSFLWQMTSVSFPDLIHQLIQTAMQRHSQQIK